MVREGRRRRPDCRGRSPVATAEPRL